MRDGACCRAGLALVLVALAFAAAEAEEKPLAGCYISTGDNDWLWESPPVQSQASIEAVFDSLRKAHGVDRVYWRGFQSECIADGYLVRPENFLGAAFWEWERHLAKEVGTSKLAVRAAHERGMEIWGFTALFDHGAHAASDAVKGMGPSPMESRLRMEHPEWVPVDRHGIRRQAGPIEPAYPEVRRRLVDAFAGLVERGGYDGLMFYTYVEHLDIWFQDEYGFNAPIAEEFRRRYGQDIRKEEFDRSAWQRLRGEGVTRFLRELKARLRPSGKKLGVAIDPQNSHYPAPWLCMKPRDFLNTGRIYLDWERWVREGIVDEIMVYCNGPLEAALNDALAATEGTSCVVSALRGLPFPPQHQHFVRAGVRNVMGGASPLIETGYPDAASAALGDSDPLARLSALARIAKGEAQAPAGDLIKAARDTNLLVRRQALRALAGRKDPAAVPVLEAALEDEEHAVRCAAAGGLGKINGPGSVAKIFDAVRRHGQFQLAIAAADALAAMGPEHTGALVSGLGDADATIRRVAAHALGMGTNRPEAAPALLKALSDPDAEVRFWAARGLARFAAVPGVGDGLLGGLADAHPTVRAACAVALVPAIKSSSRWLGPFHRRAFSALSRKFGAFGDRYEGPDAEWGFRPVGMALLALGPRGKEALEGFLSQTKDRRLAELAWEALYVPVTGYTYCAASEADALKAYQFHPKVSPARTATPRPPEPERMPYLQQGFDGFAPFAKGTLGDYLCEDGQWRTLGDSPPSPVIQDRVKHGERGNAVRLCRGKAGDSHQLDGLRADYRLTEEETLVQFWVYRQGAASFAAQWRNSGAREIYVGILVGPAGQVSVMSGDGKWLATQAQMPANVWQRVCFEVSPRKGVYSVRVGGDEDAPAAEGLPIPPGQSFNLLSLAPQPPEGGIVYVDDISVTVPNAAR